MHPHLLDVKLGAFRHGAFRGRGWPCDHHGPDAPGYVTRRGVAGVAFVHQLAGVHREHVVAPFAQALVHGVGAVPLSAGSTPVTATRLLARTSAAALFTLPMGLLPS